MEYPGRKAQYNSEWQAFGNVVRHDVPAAPIPIDKETRMVKILLGFMLTGVLLEIVAEALKSI